MYRYYCKPLTLYEEEEYRVWRSKWQKIHVERKMSYWPDPQFCRNNGIELEEKSYWSTLTLLFGYESKYRFSPNRSGKLKTNREWAEKGKQWIEHYKLLLSGSLWIVRCDDWDGQGTPCPLQRKREDGTMGCPVRFFFLGYSGSPNLLERPLPEKCPGPLNYSCSINVCVPTGVTCEDVHGFDMADLARIRHEIWKRE